MRDDLRIDWAHGPAALAGLDDSWDALASRAADPFCRSEWLLAWWRAFGGESRPALLRVWRGERLAAGLPLLATRHRLSAMTNVHTPVHAPLHADRRALDGLATAVARSRVGAFSIGPLDRDGAAGAAFLRAASRDGRIGFGDATYRSPIVDTSGTFDAYRARMRSGWKTLENRGRKAAREHALVVRAVDVPSSGVGFLEEGLRVEASGWKGEVGTAVLSRPDTAQFYRDVAARFAGRGALALSGLWLDDRLVAFDLALLHGNRYWLLKTGYDEGYRQLMPGMVLRRGVVERCFALGLDAHELLGGDDPWKRVFATHNRAHCTCYGFRHRVAPIAEYGWRRVRPQLRRVYRAIRPRQ